MSQTVLGGIIVLLVSAVIVWLVVRMPQRRNRLFRDPRIGRRFCKVEMRGCMASARGEERWGEIIAVGEDNICRAAIRPIEVRNLSHRNRHNSYLKVRYDDTGEVCWEPYWWCTRHETHWEYQI